MDGLFLTSQVTCDLLTQVLLPHESGVDSLNPRLRFNRGGTVWSEVVDSLKVSA